MALMPQECLVSRPRVLLIHSRLQPVVGDSVLQWKPFKTVSRMRMRFSTWLKPGVNETVLGQSCLQFVIEGRSFIGRERNETQKYRRARRERLAAPLVRKGLPSRENKKFFEAMPRNPEAEPPH